MNRKELLIEYLRRFRLECHYRLDMAPADFKELPFFIYDGAHKAAREDMILEYNLENSFADLFDSVYGFFKKSIVEEDNYNVADNITIKAIEKEVL